MQTQCVVFLLRWVRSGFRYDTMHMQCVVFRLRLVRSGSRYSAMQMQCVASGEREKAGTKEKQTHYKKNSMNKKYHLIMSVIVVKKVSIVLNFRGKSRQELLLDAKAYVDGLINTPKWFPYPNPSILFLQTKITDLSNASVRAQTRQLGTVAQAKVAEKKLQLALRSLAAYVEDIANNNPLMAAAIVKSANMNSKKASLPNKADFAVKTGKKRGELVLTAKAGRSSFTMNFEITLDPENPLSWRSVQNKTLSSVTVKGLVSGVRYYARASRTDKNGTYPVGIVLNAIVS
jgi:hypothetical protein